jgi:hypothetical protein
MSYFVALFARKHGRVPLPVFRAGFSRVATSACCAKAQSDKLAMLHCGENRVTAHKSNVLIALGA